MDKQPEALRLAERNEECAKAWLESIDAYKFRMDTAAELRRLHAENALLHYTLTAYTGVSEALAVEQTENEQLETQRDELLEALRYAVKQVPELITVPGIRSAIEKTGGAA